MAGRSVPKTKRRPCPVFSMREAAREIGIGLRKLIQMVRHCEINTAVRRNGRAGIPADEVKRLRSK